MCFGSVAFGATLSLGKPASVDDLIALPIVLTPGVQGSVASLQCDMTYNSTYYQVMDVDLGAAAEAAGKQVMFDIQGDSVRIIVAGFNQEAIAAGEVATLYLSPERANAPNGAYGLQDAVLSDPSGQSLPVTIPAPGKQETSHPTHGSDTGTDNTSTDTSSGSSDPSSASSSTQATSGSTETGTAGVLEVPYWPGDSDGTKNTTKAKSTQKTPTGKTAPVLPAVARPSTPGQASSSMLPGVIATPSPGQTPAKVAIRQRNVSHIKNSSQPGSKESDSPCSEHPSSAIPSTQMAKVQAAFHTGATPATSLLHDGQPLRNASPAGSAMTMTSNEKSLVMGTAIGVLIGLAACLLGIYALHRLFQ